MSTLNLTVLQKDYSDIEFIGMGAFGQVFKATYIPTSTQVAIKAIAIKKDCLFSLRSLIREIQVARTCTHDPKNIFTCRLFNIVMSTEQGTQTRQVSEASGLFQIMEYMPADLQLLLHSDQPPNFQEHHIKVITYNLLCSLNYLHSSNIMHRDIKPANILVGTGCEIKLCDFGLARMVPNELLRATSDETCVDSDEGESDT